MANVIIWNSLKTIGLARSIGAYAIKSWLSQNGYSVKIIDFLAYLSEEEILELTLKFIDDDTICIGLSSTFITTDEKIKVLKIKANLEERFPNIEWILGGYYAKFENKKSNNWIHLTGNAEDSFLRYLDNKTGKNILRPKFDITISKHSWDESDVILDKEPLPIELGRGCKFKCKFCQYPLIGKKPGTYIRDISYVKEEFLKNYHEYGTTDYYFIDDTVNEDNLKLQQLVDIVQSLPFKLSWVGYNRADLIYSNPGQSQWIKDSGCIGTFFGIESFNRFASKSVGKGWSGIHGREFLLELKDNIWRDKIGMQLSFIVGLPRETKEDLIETNQWLINNQFKLWKFNCLDIVKDSYFSQSEFERNYSQYGYFFPKPGNNHYWESDLWNRTDATDFEKYLNSQALPYLKHECWSLLSVVSMLNLTDNQKKSTIVELEEVTKNGVDKRIKEYIDRSKNLKKY